MTSYQIKGPWPGLLAIVPRPRGGEWLDDEVRALKDAGFDLVVSLLTTDETKELGLTNEAELSQAQGLQFCNFPIPDYEVPDSRKFIGELDGALGAGKKIAIHCPGESAGPVWSLPAC
jgi:protein-tyrosine phosphatase